MNLDLCSVKIKDWTRRLVIGCSTHSFDASDKAKLRYFKESFEEYLFKSLNLPHPTPLHL